MHHLRLALLALATLAAGCADDLSDAGGLAASPDIANGTNSSYARLLTVGDFLYAVNESELVTFSALDPGSLDEVDRQDIGFAIETLYHLDGNLFVGSQTAMYTYTIDAGGIPQRRGVFDYDFEVVGAFVQPCDPVVAADDVAYITLYTESEVRGACGGGFTQPVERLVVADISDLDRPTLIEARDVPTPRGLAVSGDLLFVCNEASGFTVYDVTDRRAPVELRRYPDDPAYDVIAADGRLIVVGAGSLTQYDYTPAGAVTKLGTIILP